MKLNREVLLACTISVAIPMFGQDQPSKSAQSQSEQSQQELKVSDQEMKQQVTDANKASKLIGMKVKNKQDEDLGKISDLVIDFQGGKIAYAVLTSGATLGFGGKMVAIPVQALTLQQGEKALVVDLQKQQLSQAPGFGQNNWPDLDAAQKGQTIGLAQQPQSEAAGATSSPSQQTTGAGSASITNLQQLSASSDVSALEGKQVNILSAKADEAIGQNVICISSESGQKALIKSKQPVQSIQPGQKVKVTGTLRKMPADPAQLGLDVQTAQKFRGERVYIDATQVTPASQ